MLGYYLVLLGEGGAAGRPICSQGAEVCGPGEAGGGCWSHSGEELGGCQEEGRRWTECEEAEWLQNTKREAGSVQQAGLDSCRMVPVIF